MAVVYNSIFKRLCVCCFFLTNYFWYSFLNSPITQMMVHSCGETLSPRIPELMTL
uniref:Uncharacterized protein n=1 Tax=Anguilla anguilla TaxID=7936 RepID=A0A0E9RFB1_ANGAN